MPLIKRCCCCSLETGTKIIGYIQVIFGSFLALAVLIYLVVAVHLRDSVLEMVRDDNVAKNKTMEEVEEEEAVEKVAFAYIFLALTVIFIYVLFSALMGALLLIGVYKKKLGYVKWWIRFKTGLLLVACGWLLLQLLLLLYGMDANLRHSIFSLVYDACLIVVVNSYYEEESEKPSLEYVSDQFNGVPPPAYC